MPLPKKSISFFCLLIIHIFSAAALVQPTTSDPNAIFLKITSGIETNATSQAEAQAFVEENSIIVIGNGISLAESLLLQTAKIQNPWLANIAETNEKNFSWQDGKYPLVILIGGPAQNSHSAFVLRKGWLNESYEFEGGISVETGKWKGTTIVIVSDRSGYDSLSNYKSVDYSPLSPFVPKEYVPVAATGISLILLALINLGRTVFEFKALDFGRKGQKVGEGSIFMGKLNLSELIAIIAASIVLGISISWQFFGPGPAFLMLVALNSLLCLAGAIVHELSHKIIAVIFKIKVEYRFWPAGSALTLISSYLGNAFSIQAFVLEEIEPNTAKWKVGIMKLAGPVVSAIVMVVFAALDFFNSSSIYKVVYSTSALWAMAEMLPFNGLDGKDIREWNNFIWAFFFLLIGAAYVAVTFIL